MSIFAYLSPSHNPLKMPDADKTPSQCGIKWQGPVLSGKRSLNQAMNKEESIRTTARKDFGCLITDFR